MQKPNSLTIVNRTPVIVRAVGAFVLSSAVALAQSGDISGNTGQFNTLAGDILVVLLALAVLGFVGIIIMGALTLGTNRPRGLAMVGGGLFGALLAGLAAVFVSTLTGHTVTVGAGA